MLGDQPAVDLLGEGVQLDEQVVGQQERVQALFLRLEVFLLELVDLLQHGFFEGVVVGSILTTRTGVSHLYTTLIIRDVWVKIEGVIILDINSN